MTALAMNAAAYELVQASPCADQPLIDLGSIVVGETTVSVTGTVSPELMSNAELRVNGHLVPVGVAGRFAAVVALGRAWSVEIALSVPTGERFAFRLPLADV